MARFSEGPDAFFRLSPAVDGKARCFAVQRGEVLFRIDPFFSLPEHRIMEARLLEMPHVLPVHHPNVSRRIIEGRITPREGSYSDDPSHPVYLRAQNIAEGHLDFSDAKRLLPTVFKSDADSILEDDDVVLTIDGVLLGKAAVHRKGDDECCVSNHMVRILHGTRVSPGFLSWFINSAIGQKQVKRGITGSAIPGIRTDAIGRILVPVPSSEAQVQLVAAIERAQVERQAKQAKADALLAGLDDYLIATLGLTLPPKDERKVFAVTRGAVPARFDSHFHLPAFAQTQRMLAANGGVPLGNIAMFSNEVWAPEKHDALTFRYIEISSVDRDTGEAHAVETSVALAPSRARMVVHTGDIIVSLTRPHHGSIAQITPELDGCIASTGFAVIRGVDESRVMNDYLWCILRRKMCLSQMLQRASGGNYPAITEPELAKVLIPVPAMDIQETIAAVTKPAVFALRLIQVGKPRNTGLKNNCWGLRSHDFRVPACVSPHRRHHDCWSYP